MNGKAKLVRVGWMAGALLPLLAGFTSAANLNQTKPQTNQPIQDDKQVATSPEQTAQFQPKLEKAKDLIGAKVVNDKGERLGTITDVVLTPGRDAINYVVLSAGGAWGVRDKYFAVPWSQFGTQSGDNEKLFVLKGVSRADIDQATGFDKNHWPATASENWLGIERGASMPPSGGVSSMPMPPREDRGTAAAPQPRADTERGTSGNAGVAAPATDIEHLRLSKLLGITVRNLQNEDLGKLDNAMIDVHQGKVAYGIVAMRHGFLGLNKDFVAVPWSALDLTGQPGIARLDADKDTLTALAFNRDSFPNLEDPQYSRQLYERFHATPYWESLGFVPGEGEYNEDEYNEEGNLPSSEMGNVPPSGMTSPNSGTKAPNAATPNVAAPEMIAHKDRQALTFNPNAVETIHGTVSKVQTHAMKGTSDQMLRLTIKTDDGKTMLVDVGPRSFVDRQNIIFHPGDPVTITGSLAKMGRHDVIVASQIQTADKTLSLRSPEGNPLWSLNQSRIPSASGRTYGQYPNSY